MGRNNTKRAEAKRAAKEARRAAIAQQYELPKSAMLTSKPNKLGRAMFLSKRESDKFFSSMKQVDPKVKQDDSATWNPKKEESPTGRLPSSPPAMHRLPSGRSR